ncbi:MAG: TlpA disulfide reductase family protein [Actinomycetota bacterium]
MAQAPEPAQPSSADAPPEGPLGLSRQLLVFGGLALIAVVAILAMVVGGGDDGGPDSAATSALDEFVFINEDGSEGTLAQYRGEPMVLNFYASWCAPCRAELPHFRDVQAEAGDTVQFLGVNHDIDESSWRSLNAEFELNYPTVFQRNQEIFEQLELLGMPATAFMTADGEIVHTFTGVLNDVTLKALITEHLGVEI